jgi:hypothetical protein
MNGDVTDRRPAEFVFFAMAFVGFLMAAAGIVADSIAAAVIGALLMAIPFGLFAFLQE